MQISSNFVEQLWFNAIHTIDEATLYVTYKRVDMKMVPTFCPEDNV